MDAFSKRYQHLAFFVIVALALIGAAFIVLPFVPAILWAIVLSILMAPFYRKCRKRMNENMAAGTATLATLLIVGIPITLIGLGMFVQVNSLTRDLQAATPGSSGLSLESVLDRVDATVKPLATGIGAGNFSVKEYWTENRLEITRNLTGPLGRAARDTVFTIVTLVVAFLTMFFMLRDGHRLREPALDLIPLPRANAEQVLLRLENTVHAVFVGIVMVAVLQGSLAGIMYLVVGIPNALLWGVATILLCTIPLLGAPIIYVPMALVKFSEGNYPAGIGMLIFGFLIISQIDNILRPFVIGARTAFHPMAVFFSLLGGVLAMGPIGIMAGPMLLTLLLALQDIVRERLRLSREATPAPAAEA